MKIKLILVLSLLFNFIILNSCGPAFWRQGVEDNKEFYAQLANREILRREKLLRCNQNSKAIFTFLLALHPRVGSQSPARVLPREMFQEVWKFVRDFPLQQRKIQLKKAISQKETFCNNVQEISYLSSSNEGELLAFYTDVNNLCPHQQVQW